MTQYLFSKRMLHTGIFALTLLMVAVLFGCGSPATESAPEGPTTPVAITTADSSYCIACHTDADIIDSMAVVTSTDDDSAAAGG